MELYKAVRRAIESELEKGNRSFVIYPFGDAGSMVKRILNESYGIEELCIVDNQLAKFNPEILDVQAFRKMAKERGGGGLPSFSRCFGRSWKKS